MNDGMSMGEELQMEWEIEANIREIEHRDRRDKREFERSVTAVIERREARLGSRIAAGREKGPRVMSTAIANRNNAPAPNQGIALELALSEGDLALLNPEQRVMHYKAVCDSLGLNYMTQPFQYINLSGKLTLYAKKTATDQLRQVNGISIFRVEEHRTEDMLTVTAYARDHNGREDMDIGAVWIKGLGGDNLANACMKAITKAKRRVTLSISGLGWMDESEVETVRGAQSIQFNVETGELSKPTTVVAEVVDTSTGEIIAAPANDDQNFDKPMRDGGGITYKQMRTIHAIKADKGLTDGAVRILHGLASGKLLSEAAADSLIEHLNNMTPSMVDDANAIAAEKAG